MTSKELVVKALEFNSYARIPRHLWFLPWAEEKYPEQLKQIQTDFPDDIVNAPKIFKTPLRTTGEQYEEGIFIDEWGCQFDNAHGGVIGIIRKPLIKDWSELDNLRPPEEILTLDTEAVNKFCEDNPKFVVAGTWVRPFERLQFIRTMEQAMMDIALEPPELQQLLDIMHAHYCKEVETWAKTDVDAIALMDDWGSQQGMLISPDLFRKYFKPMYKDYCDIARKYGKYVFMHSDGQIIDIIEDLIEVGVHALNSQLFCMDIEELGNRFRGRITFWGEIDRQHILSKGTTREVIEAVFSVFENLYANGGVIAQCEFGPGANPENISAVFETWNRII